MRGAIADTCAALALLLGVATAHAAAPAACRGTLYLSFDTGHMEPASAIADILARHHVRATFFIANERTKRGGHTLDDSERAFWQRLVAEGHAFGSHTWEHAYFRGDVGADGVRYVPAGQASGAGRVLDRAAVCAEIARPEARFRELTGRGFDGIWRAPGGRTTPRLLDYAQSCGWTHIGWSDAGFLGDELPSERYPNAVLLERAVARLRDGDILMAHLGIWSRREPFWPMLDPLIERLQAKGFCFATLSERGKRQPAPPRAATTGAP